MAFEKTDGSSVKLTDLAQSRKIKKNFFVPEKRPKQFSKNLYQATFLSLFFSILKITTQIFT